MFLCLISEHSLRVSTSPEMQDDLPVPGGPATMIPTTVKSNKSTYDQKFLLWNRQTTAYFLLPRVRNKAGQEMVR